MNTKCPRWGPRSLWFTFPTGRRPGWCWGGRGAKRTRRPEGGAALYRKDLGQSPGEAMIRYDGSTLTIKCAGDINIEAGGAITINGATIDLN